MSHILSGIKVIDFTQLVAGPHCTRLLAQHGAEIIKVEPLTGDPVRELPVVNKHRSGCFIQHNIGKKNLCLDLDRPQAQEICRDLIKRADIVVESFTPGEMARLNLDWRILKKINPDLIMCSITCLGQTGPLSRHPGHEYIGQAYSGILGSTGDKDGYPSLSGTAFGEISTGAHAFGAIVSALLHRHHGGGGQYLDISLLDCLFSYHAAHVQMYAATEGVVNPPRCGHHHALLSPLGLFSCHGHYVVIVALGRQWENLVKLIGREDMLTDPRFTDLLSCGTNQKFIIDAIENWLASTASFDRALQLLQENHVPCAPVFDIREVMEHPHMIARGIVQTINDRIFGEVKIPASPFKYSLFPEPLNIQAGTLGEHNHEILSNNLNYSTAKINLLEADGICTTGNV